MWPNPLEMGARRPPPGSRPWARCLFWATRKRRCSRLTTGLPSRFVFSTSAPTSSPPTSAAAPRPAWESWPTTAGFGNGGSSVSGNTYLWGQETGTSAPNFFFVTPSGILDDWPVTDCTRSFALSPQGQPSGVSDGAGNQYVLGILCGTDPSVGVNTTGILAVSPSGVITHVAGNTSGSSADGVGGTQATVRGILGGGGTVAVAFGNGYLYYGDYDGVSGVYRIRRISLTTNVVTTVLNAGVLPMGVGADYVPASSSPMGTPVALATVGNNVVFIEGDTSFYRMRMIWNP
jgi:hypothetical protein